MTTRRIILSLIATLALIGGSYVINSWTPGSSTPAHVSIGLEQSMPGFGMKTSDELIEFWRGRFERNPRDYISLTHLGQAFMRKARETGDISVYERAETALRKALELNPKYESALAYLSAVLFVKHDFQEALDLADRVYAFDPHALQALATIGDAQLELGNYTEAEAAYRQLGERSPSPPVYSRLARLAWLQGRPTEAINLMQRAADEALSLGFSGENAAWYQLQLGDFYFNTGQAEKAARRYTAALNLFDNYYLALAGLGKVRAAQGRYDEAIVLYERAVATIPQPDLLATLGDLYAITSQPDKAQRQYDMVEFIGNLEAINQVVYNRQLALFYANHDRKVQKALDLATSELAVRQDIYGYDTLAWALYKHGRYQEAVQAIDQALKLGTRDALLYYHAGMIYIGVGDQQQARTMLMEALSINPHFDLLQAHIARTTLEQLQAHKGA